MTRIGELNETPLHAALKRAVAPPGSAFEVAVDGFLVDAVHEGLLIEVQTRNAGALRSKLARLLAVHRVRLVLPVTLEKWIVKLGEPPTRRRSPKRGHPADVVRELVFLPNLLSHPNLEIELVLIREEEARALRPGMAWRRRGWVTVDRRLLSVVERRRWQGVPGLLALVPVELEEPFGTSDLAAATGMARTTAQKLVYVLRKAGGLCRHGKVGRAWQYVRADRAVHPTG